MIQCSDMPVPSFREHIFGNSLNSKALDEYPPTGSLYKIFHNPNPNPESTLSIGSCIPYRWAKLTAEEYAKAESIAARLGSRSPTNRSDQYDFFDDALRHYHRRLVADKS